MLTQTVTITQNSNPNIIIGRRSTYETQQVIFDVSWLIQTYGEGTAELLIKRPKDASAYPVVAVLDGNTLTWTVSETDTQDKGHGECEIYWYVNGGLAKSCICGITILRDIGDTTETAPDPYETWVDELARLGAETLTNAQAAEQSANNAAQSASEADNSAAAALESEENALNSENAAKASEQAAAASEQDAEQSATAARQSATEAAQSASAAESSASDAQESADNSSASADRAEQAAASIEGDTDRAEAAAQTAQGAASDASRFAGTASTKATEAAGSAATAEQAANNATQKASDASASETAAAGSASSASASATAAGNAQTAAETAQGKAEDAQSAAETAAQSIEDSAAQIDTNTADILNLKSALDTKAGILRDTASGSVASFVPDSTVPNLLGLDVHLEPIQDLHGYDSPWPAGGGKDKIDYDTTYAAFKQSDGTFRGRAGEVNVVLAYIPANLLNTAVTFSATVDLRDSGDLTQCLVQAVVGGSTINGNRISNGATGVSAVTFTPTSETDYVHITFGANGSNYFTFSQIQLELGSTATAWAPYENLCPISGRESVEVYDDPVYGGEIEWNQLFNPDALPGVRQGLTATFAGGIVSISGTTTGGYSNCLANVSVKNGNWMLTVYTVLQNPNSIPFRVTFNNSVSQKYRGNGYEFAHVNRASTAASFGFDSISAGTDFTGVKLQVFVVDLTDMFGETKADEIVAMEAAQAGSGYAYFRNLFPKDYYPYNAGEKTCVSAVNGDPYKHEIISLPETVYGGDIGVVSGDGANELAAINLSNLTWSANSTYPHTYNGEGFVSRKQLIDGSLANRCYCSRYKWYTSSQVGSSDFGIALANATSGDIYAKTRIYVSDARFSTVEEFVDSFSEDDPIVVCPLATPTSLPTTPTDISTVEGQNNVFSPDGDVTVEYAADIKTYIDNKIAAAVAAMS